MMGQVAQLIAGGLGTGVGRGGGSWIPGRGGP